MTGTVSAMGMRRGGPRATRLVQRFEAEGITLRGERITGRRLERLYYEEELFPEDAEDDQIVEYMKALTALDYGRGKSAEKTALQLVTQGKEPLRAKRWINNIADLVRMANVTMRALGPEERDALAAQAVGKPNAKPIASIMDHVDRAAGDVPCPPRKDPAGAAIHETAEDRARALNRVALDILANEPSAWEDAEKLIDVSRSPKGIFTSDPKHHERVTYYEEEDEAARIFKVLQNDVHNYATRAASLSHGGLAAGAAKWRNILDQVPLVRSVDQEARDYLAGLLSPVPIPPLPPCLDETGHQ